MRMASHHHQDDRHHHHRIRTLVFAIIVILIAMMVSAITFLRVSPASVTQSDGESVFSAVAFNVLKGTATDGKEVFNRVCATYHAVDRPANMETEPIAPPMKMIVRRYSMSTKTAEEAQSRIIMWLEEPDAEKSLMSPMAIEHHGLMPPVVLTAEERSAVAEYVMTLTQPWRELIGQF